MAAGNFYAPAQYVDALAPRGRHKRQVAVKAVRTPSANAVIMTTYG